MKLKYNENISILRQFLDNTNLSQRKFAFLMGLSQNYICELVNKKNRPSLATFKKMHKYILKRGYKLDLLEFSKDYPKES